MIFNHHNNEFLHRHVGNTPQQVTELLQTIGCNSLEELIEQTIPDGIRLSKALPLDHPTTEYDYLQHIRALAQQNKLWRTFIGEGFYGTITPPAIQRNIFENPGWYTQYTPYQAEISQGRLEALLNFQTMVAELTGMDVANASLLDEGTAAAEAMQMLHRLKNKNPKQPFNTFLVTTSCLPSTIEVLQTRAEPLGINLIVQCDTEFDFTNPDVFGCILQYPSHTGCVINYKTVVEAAHQAGAYVAVAADLLSLTLLTPPGEWGADIVLGLAQRFGVPMGYGGPHAAYFATREEFVRQMPGRVIGVSIDRAGNTAFRMAIQTREQHIRRDKATSNICTAQALLAIMASMYGVYHGPQGLKNIASRIHKQTAHLNAELTQMGYQQVNNYFFDTLLIDLSKHPNTSGLRIRRVAELDEINFRYFPDQPDLIGISLDETTTTRDIDRICRIFAEAVDIPAPSINGYEAKHRLPEDLMRTSSFLTHPVFNRYHSETELMRYIKSLEQKDLSLTHAMIPLGSCTMKLNAAVELMPVSFPEFGALHPYIPADQAKGYQAVFRGLENALCAITGFAACSLQPNSGAQGEYAGLMVIREWHKQNGNLNRHVALIPESAHGTHPASAVMAGMSVVVVKCDEMGNIDVADLKAKAEQYGDTLSCLMATYPSTHGVFETAIKDICQIIHQNGGQVYMDGANLNAQVGLTSPATIGADVCHINLHKTFSIPHGGGGPGMGPICVAEHLAPYLPGHIHKTNSEATNIKAVSAAPWGSASILLISYAYIILLGRDGVTEATKHAILNANYIKACLENAYEVLYVGEKGRVAHELIIDIRPFKRKIGIDAIDIAKRLMDYGFHAPTVSFPVPDTIMIEPTESESKVELDRFCQAMLSIREEIAEIENGAADSHNNVLKNAPHTIHELTANEWTYPYSRQKAAYPLPWLHNHKFWTGCARIDNSYGDRNLVCTCPPMEAYAS
ncbi:MAG: aminomethyl-transferring glycine dehydrogenase [Sphingobacteriales bacterium]|nr:aminomethyl-transferring glycine dehydrogenase [Sphingobacteriales bacterium]